MSTARRAYDLLRAYVNHEWVRVRDLDLFQARDELDASSPGTGAASPPQTRTLEPGTPEAKGAALRVLGVAHDAPFEDIRKAFERLSRRAEPSRFSEGSDERRHATELLRQVTWAYQELTRDVPLTEKRFRSLEIE